jgi:hypothetical protein
MSDSYSGMSIRADAILKKFLKQLNLESKITWEDERALEKCFKLSATPELIVDFNKKTVSGVISLIKVVHTFEDTELQKSLGSKGLEHLRNARYNEGASLSRMNEIMELLGGCEKDLRNRSHRKKMGRIQRRVSEILSTNEWRIRDSVLADKVSIWIASYISNGNLAALTNFCKLKVMTHSNMPIYSVKEEV